MGIGSITLGVLSFLCMIGAVFLVWVPFLGAMLGFLAPVLALFGIVLGGVALSRAREGGGENESLAIGGLITSIIAFVPSVLIAVTCSLCSAAWTGALLTPHDAGPPRAIFPDAGTSAWPSSPPGTWGPYPTPVPPSTVPPSTVPPNTPPSAVPPTAPPVTAPPAAPTAPAPAEAPTGEVGSPTPVPGSSGPALPPPPLPAGPNVRTP